MSRARVIKIVASLALTVGLLWIFLSRSGIGAIVEATSRADPKMLGLAVAAGLLGLFVRSLRWVILLTPESGVRVSTAVLCIAAGYALLALLPARLGDVARPLLLAHRDGIAKARALSSIAGERFLDLWTVAALCVIGLILLPDHGGEVAEKLRLAGLVFGAVLGVGTILLVAILRKPDSTGRLLGNLAGRVSEGLGTKVESLSAELLAGLRALTRPRSLLGCVLTSMLIWGLVIVQVGATVSAFSVDIGFGGWAVLVALSAAGVSAPTPGGAGAIHATVGWGLTGLYGVTAVTADAIAVANHIISFGPITLIGLPCLGYLLVRGKQVLSEGEVTG